jgi:cytoskeletal protein RodZ
MVGFADETVVGGGESVGARLRRAREAHGLSLDDISARTRVPTRHLKAIEEDAFDQLPAAPYSVGFAKAFADAVGLSRDEIGRDFRAEKEGYGGADIGSAYVSEETSSPGTGGLVRVLLIIVIIAAIAFGLWKSGIFGGSSQVETPAIAPPAPAATEPVIPQAAEPPASPAEDNASQNASQTDASLSRNSSSSDQGEETSGRRHRTDSGDESGNAKSSENGTAPRAGSTPGRESERSGSSTARQLNIDAQKPASSVTPPTITPPPVAPPPVIMPPPPPAAPTPSSALPSATP